MKKQYIKPLTTAYGIETEQLMAASPQSISFDGNSGSGSGALNDGNASGDGLSKGHSFDLWADDEY